ncbi:hypothetical protein LCI18_002904 [Fusarium solani-melongenae]|uniref:Uncharacterized protein n=1 Tax=Fusarium solani subsp. cucurbitae TaxID=2747967 RepID=A0ACD3YSL1_FUSSC|nr:hypothetical protein LCI18_002904 [Fusarium solani-melongenae]
MLVPTTQLAGITTKDLLELQSSPLQEPKTQEDALSELMVRLTVVPHQVLQLLQLLQFLQHHKNQHQHPVLPFLSQAKVIRTVLQMDPLHALSPVSLQQPQHRLPFPTPTLGLMVAALQETQKSPKPVHLQEMGVDKPVQDPTQMAVVTLLKRCLDHNNPRLRLDLHHLLCLPMFLGAALEMQRALLVLLSAQTTSSDGGWGSDSAQEGDDSGDGVPSCNGNCPTSPGSGKKSDTGTANSPAQSPGSHNSQSPNEPQAPPSYSGQAQNGENPQAPGDPPASGRPSPPGTGPSQSTETFIRADPPSETFIRADRPTTTEFVKAIHPPEDPSAPNTDHGPQVITVLAPTKVEITQTRIITV